MLYQTANPHGGDVYTRPGVLDFSANINPYGTPPGVVKAVADSLTLLCQYPDPYCRELVGAIAAHEGVARDWVLCGNGAADLIFAYCQALRPRKALVLSPCFSEYETALASTGCTVDHYLLTRETDFRLTDSFLDFLDTWDGDTLMLCTPNNPTGQIIPPEQMKRIIAKTKRAKIQLFVDECFLDLTRGGEGLSAKYALAENPHVFLLKAFTKSYGMAGLRLGYCLCANPQLLQKMGRVSQVWNVSIPAQMAGIAALKETEFLEKALETIENQREFLTDGLKKLGFSVIPSRTNYILFFSETELSEPLRERGILLRSCANYPGLGPGWYRTAVKLPEQNRLLLEALSELIH